MCNRNSDKSDKYNKYGNSESCLQYLVHHALHQYCEQGGKYNFLLRKFEKNYEIIFEIS